MWATAQYLSYARPPAVMDIDVTIAVAGRQSSQARAVGHVADREIFTVNAALGARPLDIDEVTGGDADAIKSAMPPLSSAAWSYRTFRTPDAVTADPPDFIRAKVQ